MSDNTPPTHDDIVFPPGWEPGAPVPDDFVDEDLAGDSPLGRRVDFGRPILALLVAAFALWLASQYTLELRYAFSDREPLDLGRAEELREHPEHVRNGQYTLPSNRHVRIEAILERRAVADRHAFYKIVGAPIIRQQDDDAHHDARLFRDIPRAPTRGEESLQPTSHDAGRLVAFEDLPERYRAIASFYGEALGIHYCGVEPSLELQRFLDNRRETLRLRLTRELQREPTPEELDARLGRHARCQTGYMFFANQSPADLWYFPLLYLLFLLALGGSLLTLVRWGRETFRDA
ncbi:MAG: hypothetical protein EA398_01185 [Deltaproteobacteria bacterium]|nr:MAG: hypothetical protein EA398_01185 [Deltaproteobacteria bacterium]